MGTILVNRLYKPQTICNSYRGDIPTNWTARSYG